jgi:hypothetical protein
MQIVQEKQAQQPSPAQIAQQQATQQAQLQAVQDQKEAAIAQRQEQAQGQIEAIKQQGQQQLELMKQQFATQNAKFEAQLQIILKNLPTVAGTLDPEAQVSWEKQHGLEGAVPPPPTMTPAGGNKPAAKGKPA